jgi:hypothetical protein
MALDALPAEASAGDALDDARVHRGGSSRVRAAHVPPRHPRPWASRQVSRSCRTGHRAPPTSVRETVEGDFSPDHTAVTGTTDRWCLPCSDAGNRRTDDCCTPGCGMSRKSRPYTFSGEPMNSWFPCWPVSVVSRLVMDMPGIASAGLSKKGLPVGNVSARSIRRLAGGRRDRQQGRHRPWTSSISRRRNIVRHLPCGVLDESLAPPCRHPSAFHGPLAENLALYLPFAC